MGRVKHLLKYGKNEETGELRPENIKGDIEFRNVTFSYPTKPD